MLQAVENSTFFKRRNIVGVDFITSAAENYVLTFCHVEKAYKKIKLKSFGEESIETLKKKTKRKDIQLNVSGKLVLYKQISVTDNADENTIISKVIPAGKVQDFYYQLSEVSGKTWCAVIRIDQLTKILEEFKSCKLNVINVSLGPLNSASFKEVIDANDLITSCSIIKSEGEITTIQKRKTDTEENQIVDGKTVSNNHVNAFATALEYHVDTDISYGQLPVVTANWSESRYHQMKLILGGDICNGDVHHFIGKLLFKIFL
ncbi:MAG: hypothetical protein JKY54_14885 [Flavobacteriales bacterium]|nr:hypothetical protein [Flavobacteriales bacterium]